MNDLAIELYAEKAKHHRQVDMLWRAHEIIASVLINGQVRTKWGIPMYCYVKDICWLNYYKDHIYVSFYQGRALTHPALDSTGLKMSSKYYITDIAMLEDSTLIEILIEAIEYQDEHYKNK